MVKEKYMDGKVVTKKMQAPYGKHGKYPLELPRRLDLAWQSSWLGSGILEVQVGSMSPQHFLYYLCRITSGQHLVHLHNRKQKQRSPPVFLVLTDKYLFGKSNKRSLEAHLNKHIKELPYQDCS